MVYVYESVGILESVLLIERFGKTLGTSCTFG